MTTITHHRRDLMIEADYLPADLADLAELRRQLVQLISSGETDVAAASADTTADSIIGWLVCKLDGVDALAASTRSRYRKILAQLSATGGGPGERGSANLTGTFVALAGAVAAAAVASGRPGAVALASPIIYDRSGYDAVAA
jgi:hypothetical protein